MKVTLLSSEMPNLLPMLHRSEGIHVSEIITDLCIRLGYFKGDIRLSTVWAQLGCALEYAINQRLAEHYPGKYIQPGEFEKDGLYLTPDLLNIDDWAIEETKLSWMSSRHLGLNPPQSYVDLSDINLGRIPLFNPLPPSHLIYDKKFWRYWVQVKAYCYAAADTQIGRLRVCFVNGQHDYKGPEYGYWEARFSRKELQQNWDMLRKHADRMTINAKKGKHTR